MYIYGDIWIFHHATTNKIIVAISIVDTTIILLLL